MFKGRDKRGEMEEDTQLGMTNQFSSCNDLNFQKSVHNSTLNSLLDAINLV